MSDTLAERCRRSFSPKHWQAGIHCYALGAVKITASDAFGLQATVKGQTSRRDHVSLDWSLDQYAPQYYGSYSSYGYHNGSSSQICRCELAPGAYGAILPRLCPSGRFDWLEEARSADADELAPLTWDDGPPWQFKLDFRSGAKGAWLLTGVLHRQDETAALGAVRFADAGIVLFDRTAARLDEVAATRSSPN